MSDYSGIQITESDTKEASETLTAYSAVRLNSADRTKVDMCDAQGEEAYGFVVEGYDSGQAAVIVRRGKVPVRVTTAASFAQGDNLTPSAEGTSDAGKVEEAATGDYIAGELLQAPSADDDRVWAQVDCVLQQTAA